MSVPAWERSLSKTQYLYETFKLNKRIGQIVMGKQSKYRMNYGDHLIKTALDALKYCQAANAIFMCPTTSEADYQRRRSYLTTAKALIDHVSTAADIFLSLNYNIDGEDQGKIDRQEEYIGSTCKTIHDLIQGVIESDAKIRKGDKIPRTPKKPQQAKRN